MKTTFHKTKIDLSEKSRRGIVDLLNQTLADIIDLGSQTRQAHWNVKGPSFIALHELFDEAYEKLDELTDEIAERIVQLGGTAYGTVRVAAKQSLLGEYPLDIFAGDDHVDTLSSRFARFGKAVREGIDAAGKLGDANTADLYTEVSRDTDMLLWKIEAHQQAKS